MAAVGDVNGDGFVDIVTANGFVAGGQGVSLLLGNGDGSFQAARSTLTTGNPTYVAIADFNRDGKSDIVIVNGDNATTISVLFGNGDGSFQSPIDTVTGGSNTLAIADFNGDGKPDLVVTGTSNIVTVLLNNGDGTFTSSYSATIFGPGLLAGDFNRDGFADFVCGGAGGVLKLGNGDGMFRDGQTGFLPGVMHLLIAGDFNSDGRTDLASILATGRPPISEMTFGLADGTFALPFITNIVMTSPFLPAGNVSVAADFNGDGRLDLFSADGLSLGNGDGTFTPGGPGFAGTFTSVPAVGDFDRNGSPDVVMATGTGIMVGLNTTGNPPKLALLRLSATAIVGGQPLSGTVFLGSPAPAGGTLVTLSSSNPAAFFPAGSTVTVPAGSASATFAIWVTAVASPTPIVISAANGTLTQNATVMVVPAFTLSSLSMAPGSLIGMFGGNSAEGAVTLSGSASDGVVVSLTSSNPGVTLPASVTVAPNQTTATFPISVFAVQANTAVTVTASYQGSTASASLRVLKPLTTVSITKNEYTVKKSQLVIEATCTEAVPNLRVYNALTGAPIGTMNFAGGGKFTGQFSVAGPLTSVAVQSAGGGLAIGPAAQK